MSTTALDGFRAAVRTWLERSCPASMRTPADPDERVWGGRNATFPSEDARVWLERMVERGFTAPTWPKAYGGAGLSEAEAEVLDEEMARLGCRPPLASLGLWMLGPVLLARGTEAQKREHLPPIARGEIRWCQGYSEPGAGSDLAGLQCRAARDGDDYVVTGQKVWTSHADKADYMFCLVRTDPDAPKREGISFLLIDMASPGVTVRPIELISGASPFCETFFDGVRVPAKNLVGGENAGWAIAKELLGYERQLIARARDRAAEEDETLPQLALRCRGADARGRLADPVLRDRVAAAEIDFLCNKVTLRRSREAIAAGLGPGPETSMFKLAGTELNQRRKLLRVEAAGYRGLGWKDEAGFTARELRATREWLRSRANTIEGGTSEIQLNIIAKRVLGLPDRRAAAPESKRVLTEEQRAIAKTARDVARERLPVAHLRALRDAGDRTGLSRQVWRELAELGFAGMTIDERWGGAGLGLAELGLVAEELGRTLAPTPLLATTVLGAGAVALAGTAEQRETVLPAVGAGEMLLALAHEEGDRHDPYAVAATATPSSQGLRLDGAKSFVLDGGAADAFVAVVRTAGAAGDRDGLSLVLVPARSPGVSVTPLGMVDSRGAARVVFNGVSVPESAVLGLQGGGADVLDAVLDRGRAVLAAEMLGGCRELLARTLAYLEDRHQFDAPIGSFQALQHRAARLFCAVELDTSIVAEALRAADESRADAAALAAAAKARLSASYLHIAQEAIQMHGGIGVTDDCDVGLFYKRAAVCAPTLGDAAWCRARFAALSGF